jgi:hypothetical protein
MGAGSLKVGSADSLGESMSDGNIIGDVKKSSMFMNRWMDKKVKERSEREPNKKVPTFYNFIQSPLETHAIQCWTCPFYWGRGGGGAAPITLTSSSPLHSFINNLAACTRNKVFSLDEKSDTPFLLQGIVTWP